MYYTAVPGAIIINYQRRWMTSRYLTNFNASYFKEMETARGKERVHERRE